jgi:hypothetical protein
MLSVKTFQVPTSMPSSARAVLGAARRTSGRVCASTGAGALRFLVVVMVFSAKGGAP